MIPEIQRLAGMRSDARARLAGMRSDARASVHRFLERLDALLDNPPPGEDAPLPANEDQPI